MPSGAKAGANQLTVQMCGAAALQRLRSNKWRPKLQFRGEIKSI